MAHRHRKLTAEQAYIKTVLKVQREEIGFIPSRTHESRKSYNRARDKRGVERLACEF